MKYIGLLISSIAVLLIILTNFYYNSVTLNIQKIKDYIVESNIILDIPMANQNGLSMRTFECMGYHKKIITTNKNVLNYDFYKPENIYYYDGEKIDFDNIFFKSEYLEIDEEILKKYSLDTWVDKLLMED